MNVVADITLLGWIIDKLLTYSDKQRVRVNEAIASIVLCEMPHALLVYLAKTICLQRNANSNHFENKANMLYIVRQPLCNAPLTTLFTLDHRV